MVSLVQVDFKYNRQYILEKILIIWPIKGNIKYNYQYILESCLAQMTDVKKHRIQLSEKKSN